MSAAPQIPVLDFSPFRSGDPEGKRRVAAGIARACETVGFFYLSGHGPLLPAPRDLVKELYAHRQVREKAIAEELVRLECPKSIDDLEICSMIPFEITSERTDQSDKGKLTPTLVGTAQQITDNLKRFKEAGLDMPLIWPPFSGVPTSKTMDDLKRLKNDIMPKVNAI